MKALLLQFPSPLRDLAFDEALPANGALLHHGLIAVRGAESGKQGVRASRAQGPSDAGADVGVHVAQLHPLIDQVCSLLKVRRHESVTAQEKVKGGLIRCLTARATIVIPEAPALRHAANATKVCHMLRSPHVKELGKIQQGALCSIPACKVKALLHQAEMIRARQEGSN